MKTAPKFGLTAVLAAALLLGATAGADATLYRWVDKDGHVHYGDDPAANAQQVNPNRLDGHTDSSSSGSGDTSAAAAAKLAECKRKSDDLARFQNAITISETDALGNTKEYTAEQKDQLVAKTKKYVADNCAAPGAPGAPAS